MKVRECQQCGATLPEAPDDLAITCQFCGTTYDPTTAFRPALKIKMNPEIGRRILWIVAASFLVPILLTLAIFVIMGAVTCGIVSSAKKAMDGASTSGPSRAAHASSPRGGAIKPSDLASHEPLDWQTLDCAPPPGGAGNLEAVAAIPWALSLAQAWRLDARLYRVDVEKVRADGLVNAQDDAASSVTYWFLSPSRLEEQRRQADLGQSNVQTELMLEVSSGKARAMVSDGVTHVRGLDGLPPPHPASLLPLKQILDGLERGGELPSKPFYNGDLTYYSHTWFWQFLTLSNRESIPSVRASDGRPYP